jgi:hypothetical protein
MMVHTIGSDGSVAIDLLPNLSGESTTRRVLLSKDRRRRPIRIPQFGIPPSAVSGFFCGIRKHRERNMPQSLSSGRRPGWIPDLLRGKI